MSKGLSIEEYSELVTLEYVLTWGYSKNKKKDEAAYKKLTKRDEKYKRLFDWRDYFLKYYSK